MIYGGTLYDYTINDLLWRRKGIEINSDMKRLLIIGAGGHGKVVKEIAEAVGNYEKIDFIDDYSQEAIGKICDLEKFHNDYDSAFPGIGDNRLRKELIQRLLNVGYEIPVLIHPTAYVSKSSEIKMGTVVELKAIINANACVGEGCIISVGAIVDHDVIVNKYAHVNAGAICKAGGIIEAERKMKAGEVQKGY